MPDFEEMEKAMSNANYRLLKAIFDEDDDEQGNGLPRRWRQTSCSCSYYDNNSPCAYCDPVDEED